MLDFIKRNKSGAVDHNFINKSENSQNSDATVAKPQLSTYQKVINFCLYALVVLTPILFTSLTSDVRDFNKQALIFLVMAIMLGVFVVKILVQRNVSWVKTPLDYVLLGYLGVYLLTSLTSLDKPSSFLGYYGRFTGSFISVLSLIILYFLVVNNVRSIKTIKRVVNYLMLGSGLVLVYSFLQLLGLYILPAAYTHSRGFNPIGSMVGLAIYAALNVIFLQWMLFADSDRSKLKTILLWVLSIVALAILFIVNAFIGWLVMTLGLVAFLALAMASDQSAASSRQSAFLWKPMLMLVIGVLFVAFQFLPQVLNPRNLINSGNLPIEIQLSNSTTWRLVGNSLKTSAKTAVLGSGPGTTGIVFGQIKPEALNNTVVWNLTFDRASSEVANIAIETGLLGLVVFELTAILFFVYGLFFLLRNHSHEGWLYAFGFFTLWLALYCAHFFYFFNATFYLLYWLSLALFMAISHLRGEEEQTDLSFSSSPRSALSWMFVTLILMAGLLVGVFFNAAVYGGEVAYAAGVKALNQTKPDLARVSNNLGRAIQLNPYRDVYLLAYGQSLIFRAQEESAKDKPDGNAIQSYMSDMIAAGQQATALSPGKSSNWQALSQFYAAIKPLVPGADQFVIDSLQKAVEHDPNSPSLHFQLALANFAAASGKDDKGALKLDKTLAATAEKELNRVIELKADLPDPYIQLARVLEAGEKAADGKKKMDEAVKVFPYNADILFETGRLAYNLKLSDEALALFTRVVAINPNYANAHYSLGLIYQQKGDKAKALAEFEKTREITGPNEDLDKLIESLKASK